MHKMLDTSDFTQHACFCIINLFVPALCYCCLFLLTFFGYSTCFVQSLKLSFLFAGHGTVWSQGNTFPGAQRVPRGPRWRLGMGGGCGLLLCGGFHLWHHQDLWHFPPGPDGGVWRDQQSGLLDCFHLRVCHDLQWWVQLMRLSKSTDYRVKWQRSCENYCTIVYTKQQFVLHGSSGPLSSMMTNRFGFQFVVMIGGFLISSGTIATSFTSSINQMYITYGVVAGIELLSSYFVSLVFSSLSSWIRVLKRASFLLCRSGLLPDLPTHRDHPFPVLHPTTVTGHSCGFHWRVPVHVCLGTRSVQELPLVFYAYRWGRQVLVGGLGKPCDEGFF